MIFYIYNLIVFFVFNCIYLYLMIFFPHLWVGIDTEERKFLYNLVDSFYFTVCTHSSLGFGDITPKSQYTRLITSFHMIFVFVPFVIEYLD